MSRDFCTIEIGLVQLELVGDIEPIWIDRDISIRARIVIHHIPTVEVVAVIDRTGILLWKIWNYSVCPFFEYLYKTVQASS